MMFYIYQQKCSSTDRNTIQFDDFRWSDINIIAYRQSHMSFNLRNMNGLHSAFSAGKTTPSAVDSLDGGHCPVENDEIFIIFKR
jgi:hypothetical protein